MTRNVPNSIRGSYYLVESRFSFTAIISMLHSSRYCEQQFYTTYGFAVRFRILLFFHALFHITEKSNSISQSVGMVNVRSSNCS